MQTWRDNGQSEANLVDCLFAYPLFIVTSDKCIVPIAMALELLIAAVLDTRGLFWLDQHTSNLDKLRPARSLRKIDNSTRETY